jgi:hypothetical protein
MKKAHSEGKTLTFLSSGDPLAEISRIESWDESYGNFVIKENENRVVLFNAADILLVENTPSTLKFHLKIGIIPPVARG